MRDLRICLKDSAHFFVCRVFNYYNAPFPKCKRNDSKGFSVEQVLHEFNPLEARKAGRENE